MIAGKKLSRLYQSSSNWDGASRINKVEVSQAKKYCCLVAMKLDSIGIAQLTLLLAIVQPAMATFAIFGGGLYFNGCFKQPDYTCTKQTVYADPRAKAVLYKRDDIPEDLAGGVAQVGVPKAGLVVSNVDKASGDDDLYRVVVNYQADSADDLQASIGSKIDSCVISNTGARDVTLIKGVNWNVDNWCKWSTSFLCKPDRPKPDLCCIPSNFQIKIGFKWDTSDICTQIRTKFGEAIVYGIDAATSAGLEAVDDPTQILDQQVAQNKKREDGTFGEFTAEEKRDLRFIKDLLLKCTVPKFNFPQYCWPCECGPKSSSTPPPKSSSTIPPPKSSSTPPPQSTTPPPQSTTPPPPQSSSTPPPSVPPCETTTTTIVPPPLTSTTTTPGVPPCETSTTTIVPPPLTSTTTSSKPPPSESSSTPPPTGPTGPTESSSTPPPTGPTGPTESSSTPPPTGDRKSVV